MNKYKFRNHSLNKNKYLGRMPLNKKNISNCKVETKNYKFT